MTTASAQTALPFGWPSGHPPIVTDERTPKQKGQDLAMGSADEEWKKDVLRVIESLASRQMYITSDAVREVCRSKGIPEAPPGKDSRGVWGGQMSAAAKAGLILSTDRVVQTRREEGRHRKIQLWKSRLFEDGDR